MKVLFLLFILVPLLEVIVLVKVGSLIGALPTIALVILTAVIGMALLRRQGLNTLAKASAKLQSGQVPLSEMVEGLFLAVGGALLLTPGFITDAFGLACLIPGLRHLLLANVFKMLVPQMRVHPQAARPFRDNADEHTTVDGEYTTVDEERPKIKSKKE